MKLIKLILIAFIFVSCGKYSGPIAWSSLPVGIAATSEDDLKVMELYNETFGFEVFVYDENGVTITRQEELGPNVKGLTHTKFDANGYIYFAEITIDANIEQAFYRQVLAHELGHVLGAIHSDSGLMRLRTTFDAPLADQMACDDLYSQLKERYPDYF